METVEDLIELLQNETVYIQNVSLTYGVGEVTSLNVELTIIPENTHVPAVMVMSKKAVKKKEAELEDELFEI